MPATTQSLRLAIRQAELTTIRSYFPPCSRVLEIGGGSGWQASLIASWGCEIRSLDIEPEQVSHHPVERYDGRRIPAESSSFDVVFSSHVLEHVEGLEELLSETARVLRPGGVMIHVLPSASWRFWTLLAHYPYLAKRLVQPLSRAGSAMDPKEGGERIRGAMPLNRLRRLVWSGVHGSHGNAITELVLFSRWPWRRRFRTAGLRIISEFRTGIWYTGYKLAPSLTVDVRRPLAKILGSSTHVFILQR